jgi:hypothetical protein
MLYLNKSIQKEKGKSGETKKFTSFGQFAGDIYVQKMKVDLRAYLIKGGNEEKRRSGGVKTTKNNKASHQISTKGEIL